MPFCNYDLVKGSVLTIGNFDGLHLGHKKLVNAVTQYAKKAKKPSVIYTFSPHPVRLLYPDKKHKLLCSREQTINILREMGVDYLIIEPFTRYFSQISPKEFIERYIVFPIQPTSVIVGYDFKFGTKGTGSIQLLEEMGTKHNFRLKIIPPMKKKGLIVSSSLIKDFILSGKWELVPVFLGRPFSLRGLVVKGEGRGKNLGFPTINLKVKEDILLPVNGVYTAGVRKKNKYFYAVVNVGTTPTFSTECLKKIEVHLIEREEKWREKECEVDIFQYIRPEKKFSDGKELTDQINKDIDWTRQYFSFLS